MVVGNAMWVDISGEVDLSNHGQLEAQLTAVDLQGVDRVHLKLAHLRFCDVRGFRELLRFADAAREAGRAVVIHSPGYSVRALCRAFRVEHMVVESGP